MYREQHADRPGIVLWSRSSTFWLRFIINLRHRRFFFAVLGSIAFVIALAISLMLSWTFRTLFLDALYWATAILEAVFVGPAVLGLVIASASPSPNERLLPARMILREEGVEVFPRDGDPFEARWNYIAEAIERPGECELILRKEPRLIWLVKKSMMSQAEFELLMKWLRDNLRLPEAESP